MHPLERQCISVTVVILNFGHKIDLFNFKMSKMTLLFIVFFLETENNLKVVRLMAPSCRRSFKKDWMRGVDIWKNGR